MKLRATNIVPSCAPALVLIACGLAPSRAPLGGDYSVAETAPGRDLRAQNSDRAPVLEAAEVPPPAPPTVGVVGPAAALSAARPSAPADSLRYDLLKTGDSMKAELSVSFNAELVNGGRGVLPGNGALGLDAKLLIEVKVTRASAQSLDELELTITPDAIRTEIAGNISQLPQAPPKTFELNMAGRSPTLRAHGGATLDAQERAALMLLLTPLLSFHEHWARSPTLELVSGWSRETSLPCPRFSATRAIRCTSARSPRVTKPELPAARTCPFKYRCPSRTRPTSVSSTST